jgi:hypothetical protein
MCNKSEGEKTHCKESEGICATIPRKFIFIMNLLQHLCLSMHDAIMLSNITAVLKNKVLSSEGGEAIYLFYRTNSTSPKSQM